MAIEYKSLYRGVRIINTPNGSYLVGPDASSYNDKELIPLVGINEVAIRISKDNGIGIKLDDNQLELLLDEFQPLEIIDDKSDKVSRSLNTKILPDN